MDKSEQLLSGLISGDVTPGEFLAMAREPNIITCRLIPVYVSPACPAPDDPCLVTVDGIRRETAYSEYLALRARYPDACCPPVLFVCCPGCSPGDPLCHCIAE